MLTIVFAVAAVICAFKWYFWRVTAAVLMWYVEETGNPIPSKEKMGEGYKWVGEQLFKDLTVRKGKR